MSYKPFQFTKSKRGSATLATIATVRDEKPETVAIVATVARGERENSCSPSDEPYQNVATVAGLGRKNEPYRETLEAEAADRNREAAEAGLSDRWCACGTMATVAVGRFRQGKGNPEGVARWLCNGCLVVWGKSKGTVNDE